ncbi:MAG: arginine--tRNA ligase [Burkholderiales bacterium]|nr:arginine--tRNA ligase [Burkholderiales bacterium]
MLAAVKRIAPDADDGVCANIVVERPKQAAHGDYACNAAMVLARALKKNPRELAQQLQNALPPSPHVARHEIAGAGFLNLFLTQTARVSIVRCALEESAAFGHGQSGNGQRVIVEFVSANPTGPLHVGHGRQAALGDAIANLLSAQGFKVSREFYYNDAGQQIHNLALSVQARAYELRGEAAVFPESGYHGDYIREIAQSYLDQNAGRVDDLDGVRRFAVAALRKEQDIDLQAFGVYFDNYYLESSLYTDGRVEATVQKLVASGHTYEQDGALWLRTTDFGDDKDRVMRKADGHYTYFVPDVAYHVTKWERGFTQAINIQGTDHHGTIARVRAGLQALNLGIPKDYPAYVLHKMVTVMRGHEEVKISKRAGSYVTVRDLIDEVGRDAVRFFLSMRKADTEFVFDLELARSQAEENPVYYVQYAHARVMSVLRQAQQTHDAVASASETANLALLDRPHEEALLRRLADFPADMAVAARELAPHHITAYLRELAGEFHGYYNAERFLVDDAALRQARLTLVVAVGQTLRNGLAVLGITAPNEM